MSKVQSIWSKADRFLSLSRKIFINSLTAIFLIVITFAILGGIGSSLIPEEKIDTKNVPCTTRAIEVINVFRKDEKKNSDCTEELLELGPSREDKYFKVPKIINEWVSCFQ